MPFERYIKQARILTPTVTVLARGQLLLNRGAAQCFHVDQFQYVVLFYDDTTVRIGFQFTNNEGEEGRLTLTKWSGQILLNGAGFLHYFALAHPVTRRYRLTHDATSGLTVADLRLPLPATRKQAREKVVPFARRSA